jgi:hypothetical protein
VWVQSELDLLRREWKRNPAAELFTGFHTVCLIFAPRVHTPMWQNVSGMNRFGYVLKRSLQIGIASAVG